MMTTSPMLIDGKQQAQNLINQLTNEVAEFKQCIGITPTLAVVLVGDDPASQVYVNNKIKQTKAVGMDSLAYHLPASVKQEVLIHRIKQLNEDPEVHAILVQLPLPEHIDSHSVICTIHPDKDVDGFHPTNIGLLTAGKPGIVPCTPLGVMKLLASVKTDLTGLDAVVIGRSNIVGKPLVHLLMQADCTVTLTHSKTTEIAHHVKRADIVIAAVGLAHMVRADWVKPGAVVIDVGINRISRTDGKSQLVGDVDFAAVSQIAGAITPVPGGVGPMTIACLLANTLELAKQIDQKQVNKAD